MEIIGIGEFEVLVPHLVNQVGKEYVIIDIKKKLIVGKVKVVEAPKKLVLNEKYVRKEVKKSGIS